MGTGRRARVLLLLCSVPCHLLVAPSVVLLVRGQKADIRPDNCRNQIGVYAPANTITLVPQTISGTVVDSQHSGSFVDYTVSLASYDLFPTLAVQQGQTTLLNNPSQIEVYVDNNPQRLNTQALARQRATLLRAGLQ